MPTIFSTNLMNVFLSDLLTGFTNLEAMRGPKE